MSDDNFQQELTGEERLTLAAQSLQYDLAMQDRFEDMFSSTASSTISSMELIVLKLKDLAITIRMDGNRNHHRGHVHVDYRTALRGSSFAIDSGERLVGRPTPYDDKITAWILKNRADLDAVWSGMRASGYSEKAVARLRGNGF